MKTLCKTITWRIIASGISFGIAYIVTRSISISSSVALAEVIFKTVVYYAHEKVWEIYKK